LTVGHEVEVTTLTESGGHPLNEDAFLVQQHPADPDCWLCFLADGQGGRSGGGEAARLACRAGLDVAVRARPERPLDGRTWATVLSGVDYAVASDVEAGFTTLVGFCIRGGVITGASSGDSAVLAVTGGEARELTAVQRKNPPVGSGGAVFVPFSLTLTEPWKVLVMSDGVWKYAGWDAVVKAATTMSREGLMEALKDAARLPGSGRFPDDFTVVVFEGAAG
jgi:serine/threonine protein phosphatase PrpC